MIDKIKKCWLDLKCFDWKIYLSLCLLALIPAIYQTTITRIITSQSIPGSLDIIGQIEWFDLIDETIKAFLIIPMYSLLSKAFKSDYFNQLVFKFGIVISGLYLIFSIVTLICGLDLVSFMNPNEIDINEVYRYLSLETISFMIGIISSYLSIVFLVVGKAKYMYVLLFTNIILSLLGDFFLVPKLGVNGIAISNIISNTVISFVGILLIIYERKISLSKFNKQDSVYFKEWLKTGLFAGTQQFLDNIIYSLMIVRMVNAVSESGNYWLSNNFIWGWLLIPITCLSEVIRKDAGINGYNLKQKNYYSIVIFVIVIWFALIPTYKWFFNIVEGIDNYNRIFEIVMINLGFYIAYALSQIPDAIFVGLGKTKYIAINSFIVNIVYYGIWFAIYITSNVTMNMNMIIFMFGCGNVVHWAISLIEEKLFLRKVFNK